MDYEMDATQALPMDDEEFEEDDQPSDKVVCTRQSLGLNLFTCVFNTMIAQVEICD